MTPEELQKELFFATAINDKVLDYIRQKKYLHIWVPQQYKGLDCALTEGLQILHQLSKIDGSLGWFTTLCSGANYFSRNINPTKAQQIFESPNSCLGGSGMIGGSAEKIGNKYIINGHWHYATGAPHLSHFTLNAQIIENGAAVKDETGQDVIQSFVLSAHQVEFIPSWETMGMKATNSYSFKVNKVSLSEEDTFLYNKYYTNSPLDKIDFQAFADFTLLVNYLGVAQHFMEESYTIKQLPEIEINLEYIHAKTKAIFELAKTCELHLTKNKQLEEAFIKSVHHQGEEIVSELTHKIVTIYPKLGVKAAKTNEVINQIFRDFFTITQHQNFRKK